MDCHGNYVLIKPKHDAHEVARLLEDKKKTLVHTYSNPLLKHLLRVTIGSPNAMMYFIKAFLEIDGEK